MWISPPPQDAHGPFLWVLVWVWGWDAQTASTTSGHRICFMLKVSNRVQGGSKVLHGTNICSGCRFLRRADSERLNVSSIVHNSSVFASTFILLLVRVV